MAVRLPPLLAAVRQYRITSATAFGSPRGLFLLLLSGVLLVAVVGAAGVGDARTIWAATSSMDVSTPPPGIAAAASCMV